MHRYAKNGLTGEELFTLYDTYGFPVELSVEEAYKQEVNVSENWREEFESKMEEQRSRSRTARKGEFHGGLEGTDPIHLKYHTATHLLGQALREVVSKDIQQHGSNITSERLRFDFNSEKLTPEQKQAVEDLINQWIDEDYPVNYEIYPTAEALSMDVIGAFGERYGDDVKVYRIGTAEKQISFEVCGGPHVEHTGMLKEGGKRFKILKEEASSAGVRRIKAVLQ
jgi:alanyl-tRNA synthetase